MHTHQIAKAIGQILYIFAVPSEVIALVFLDQTIAGILMIQAQYFVMGERSKEAREIEMEFVHPHAITGIMDSVEAFAAHAAHHVWPTPPSFLPKREKPVVIPFKPGRQGIRTDLSIIHPATKPVGVDSFGSRDGMLVHAGESPR